jgi:hypothetical protein
MKLLRTTALTISALLVTLGSTAGLHGKSKSFEVDFDKCFVRAEDGDPYIFTFAGPASGDVSGTVEASALNDIISDVEPNQTYLAADYVVTSKRLSFTARVGGRVNDQSGLAVLQGYVSAGPAWLVGAAVLDEFENHTLADGTPCSKGTLFVTPVRWKPAHKNQID